FDISASTARIMRESPWRTAFIATSSWSHAFITEKHHFLYPDVEADIRRFEELRGGRFGSWRDINLAEIEACGQHELLNWVCLAGAMTELGATPEVLDFSPSYIFNSSKCTMVAGPV
ncbi:MAG: extradiol ring-cleavage dioxygenase, partial [Chloroflexi bacterium]|nr:extradiol ring-cleavage dioxygenase [Chloroflexota bacterium]